MLSPYAGGQLEGLFYSLPSAKTLTTKQSELRDTRAALRSLMFYFIRDWHPQKPTSTCLQDLIPSCLTEGNGSSMLLLSSIAPVLPRSFPFSMHVALFSLSQFSLDSFRAPIHACFPLEQGSLKVVDIRWFQFLLCFSFMNPLQADYRPLVYQSVSVNDNSDLSIAIFYGYFSVLILLTQLITS